MTASKWRPLFLYVAGSVHFPGTAKKDMQPAQKCGG